MANCKPFAIPSFLLYPFSMGLRWMRWLLLGLFLSTTLGAERRLKVVTTFLPAYCFTANVAGTSADVENLLPGTVNLHDYQLSPRDVRTLAQADLILINGLGLESFLDRALSALGGSAKDKIVRLSDGLSSELIPLQGGGHDHSYNPHIWLDPRLAMHAVTNIQRALAARDPQHAAAFQENAAVYLRKLQSLDVELARDLSPIRTRPFVTYHDAFPYFVRRYGLNLAGVVERVPEVPPSPRELSALLAVIREQKVKVLFSEPGGTARLAQQVANDTGISEGILDPLETGQLEPAGYELGMRRNRDALLKGLR